MRRKVNRLTDELKLRAVKEYLTTDISQKELKLKYGFNGNASLYRWMDKFGMSIPDDKTLKLQATMSNETKKSRSETESEAKLKKLEAELAYEKLRNQALVTMIDIAEDRFKISIRKKSGPKQ